MEKKKYIFRVQPGGIWQRFMMCIVSSVEHKIDFDDVYISFMMYGLSLDPSDQPPFLFKIMKSIDTEIKAMASYGIDNAYDHTSHYVLEQNKNDFMGALEFYPMTNTYYDHINKVENSPSYLEYKRVLNKFNIKQEIKESIDARWQALGLDEKTLSVHIRLTSLTTIQGSNGPIFGNVSTETYFDQIDKELATGEYNNIFIASDNFESIQKMQTRYGNLIKYNEDFALRYNIESTTVEDLHLEYERQFKKQYWVETFVDALMLAKGSGLVCRAGNSSNISIIKSDTFKRITRII